MSESLRVSMLLNAFVLASLLASSHALLKWVARKEVASYLELVTNYWLPIGTSLAIYGGIFFYYIQVLRRHDIGVLYSTYTGASILLVLLFGIFFFGESLSRMQIVGCGLVILGIFFIGKPEVSINLARPLLFRIAYSVCTIAMSKYGFIFLSD